ncbi:MAG: TolC family protein [Flavobacteriaceae bacterium]|nr:TolC family protein [Bacteroidia bacterium]NNK87364.1 TolC family protein [Flavobacteriaceae bacterium]
MKAVVLGLFFLLTVSGWSQDAVRISKSEVLDMVLENNHQIRISEQEFLSSQADYRQTNALFFPNISISHTGFVTTNPLMAFGSKLNQASIRASDFDPDILNDPDQTQNVATKFEIQQPLINFDGFWKRKAARSTMEANQLNRQRTGEFLTYEADRAYTMLQLAERQLQVLEKNLKLAEANKTLAQNRFEQGLIQQADVLLFDVRFAEVSNQLQHARSSLQNASDYLAFLMNKTDHPIYLAGDSLKIDTSAPDIIPKLSPDRADIKAMDEVTRAYANASKADKLAFLPNINAFGSYELYDQNFFNGEASGYLVGIGMNWTILDGTKRFSKTKKSKAEYEKAKTEFEQYKYKSELELRKAWRQFQDAKNNLELTKLAKTQAQQALKIRSNRFKEGLERATDLLFAEVQASQKELEYYQSMVTYNSTLSYLNFLTENPTQ